MFYHTPIMKLNLEIDRTLKLIQMKKNKLIPIAVLVLSLFFGSCEPEEIMSFQAEPAINFTQTTQTYSFLGNSEGVQTMEIPVRIMGNAVDRDRTFNVKVIEENNVPAGSYEIVGGVIEAGKFTGNLIVKVFNSPALADSEASVLFEISDSNDFNPGNTNTRQYRLNWTDRVVVPSWSLYRFFFTSVASPAAYRAIVESTGLTTFTLNDYRAIGPVGAQALGTQFGNYVKQWNLDNPENPLLHDAGPQEGQPIVPLYYSKSLYD